MPMQRAFAENETQSPKPQIAKPSWPGLSLAAGGVKPRLAPN
jgi:hypothetical protein